MALKMPAISTSTLPKAKALRFVLLIGVVSLFADLTYEGSRSITGQFLATLGTSATVVGVVAGLGELLGYGLRLVSGRLSERTQKFWPITLFGYFIQMISVPLLALAGNWQVAALLILVERVGKATRNPPRDVMLSHAAKQIGYGWGFGVHEALDQLGALFGPLLVAAVVAHRGNYRDAFAVLLVPALLTLTLVTGARFVYPRPEDLETHTAELHAEGFSRSYWIYLGAAALVAAGFADFQLIAYHFQKADAFKVSWIPILYAVAMGVSGAGSLAFGRMFDRFGTRVLIPLTVVSALFAPFVFFGGFWTAVIGAALWGLGMGVHESIVPAAVAGLVSPQRRPSAYGMFTGAYGVAWFAGSAIEGVLYDHSVTAVVVFCLTIQMLAVPFLWNLGKSAPSLR
ncbi:MAG: MFS transporter [Candidatus Korobacteraceae bacterium]